MYIAEHVHVTHSSIAWSGSVCETHPVLDLDGFSAVHGQSTPPQTGGLRGDPFSPDVSLEEASWPSVQVNVRVCAWAAAPWPPAAFISRPVSRLLWQPGLDQEARKASCMKSSHAVGFLQRLFVYGTAVTIKTKGIQTPSPEHNQLLFFGPLCHLRLFGETFLTSAVSNIDRSFQTDFQHLRKIQWYSTTLHFFSLNYNWNIWPTGWSKVKVLLRPPPASIKH